MGVRETGRSDWRSSLMVGRGNVRCAVKPRCHMSHCHALTRCGSVGEAGAPYVAYCCDDCCVCLHYCSLRHDDALDCSGAPHGEPSLLTDTVSLVGDSHLDALVCDSMKAWAMSG